MHERMILCKSIATSISDTVRCGVVVDHERTVDSTSTVVYETGGLFRGRKIVGDLQIFAHSEEIYSYRYPFNTISTCVERVSRIMCSAMMIGHDGIPEGSPYPLATTPSARRMKSLSEIVGECGFNRDSHLLRFIALRPFALHITEVPLCVSTGEKKKLIVTLLGEYCLKVEGKS